MKALGPAEIAPVLEGTRPFPARAYVDEEVFAFERARIFGEVWLCVGRDDAIALPGQWIREEIAGEPILVVRGADLGVRAFFDVCRHRGASIVGRAANGRSARFECPYHGWTYELDGRCPGGDLLSVRTDAWRGFRFVTLSERAPPLEEWLGTTPPWLGASVLDALRLGRRDRYEVLANYKLVAENFQESHHFTRVHPALERLTPTREARTWVGDPHGPWLGGTMEIVDAETVSLDGSCHGRPRISNEPRVFDALLFPALFTSLQPDYLLTYRLSPHAVGKTAIVADIYFHPAAFVAGFDPRDVYEFWDRVNAEDRAICEDQQANASSRAFVPSCYLPVEEGVHAFDERIARYHR